MPTSVDKMRNVPGQTVQEPLEKAVDEGKRDVAEMQAAGAEKLGQVKEMAAKATSSAQVGITFFAFSTWMNDYQAGISHSWG